MLLFVGAVLFRVWCAHWWELTLGLLPVLTLYGWTFHLIVVAVEFEVRLQRCLWAGNIGSVSTPLTFLQNSFDWFYGLSWVSWRLVCSKPDSSFRTDGVFRGLGWKMGNPEAYSARLLLHTKYWKSYTEYWFCTYCTSCRACMTLVLSLCFRTVN